MSELKQDEDAEPTPNKVARYDRIIEHIFHSHWNLRDPEFEFERHKITAACEALKIEAPKNLGDVIYTFRYRKALPKSIVDTEPPDRHWLILGAGDARYRFRLNILTQIMPTRGLLPRKIPDATPAIITKYAMNDEQALLAKVRYNRLVDIFLGVAAYSLQNHLRTKIVNYGQIEIDELYIGVDSRGAQYIVPVQAKAGNDKLGVIQTIQDFVFCSENENYSHCICRPVSAQFLDNETIALFETTFDGNEVSIVSERHYRLVAANDITTDDLKLYRGGV
jgi:hypothetical protein